MQNDSNEIEKQLQQKYKYRENINKTLSDFSSRYSILSELEKDYEGYYESVKAILKQKENNNPLFTGICGAVGELLSVDKNYETALETALGGNIQNIVTRTEKDAGKAIEYLKKSKKGRATFLPINSVSAKEIPENVKTQILKENGVINFAKKLIKYSLEYENIFSNLLERVIVLDNFNNAVSFAKKYNYSYRIVTLNGELLNPGGSITGGSISKKNSGIFSRNRELKELKEKISFYTIKLNEADNEIQLLKEKIIETNDTIENINTKTNTILLKKNDLKNQIIQTENYINDLYDKFNTLTKEEKSINNRILEQTKKLSSLEKDIKKSEKEISDIHSHLNKYQSEVQSNKDVREENSKKLTELKVEINEIEFTVSSLSSDIIRINNEIEKCNANILKNKRNILKTKDEISVKENEIEFLSENNLKIKEISKNKQNKLESENNKKTKLSEENEKAEKQSLEHIEYISKIKNEKVRLELLKEQLEDKKTRICDDIWEKYEITIASAQAYEKSDIEISKLRSEENNLKNEIREMGTVNTEAVEEYKRVQDRYDFLINQRKDILYAEENLKNIIIELSSLMENQFKEQFKIINENFGKVFSEVFGGGNGYVKLSDEKDVLNSGIEIIAQPPGKSIQNMSLLSGGERALTAIALLFAILKMKPSPFCILDEIEAALDDANVKRYADYLKRFAKDTQFIVITHRKGSMEAADTLYGITMQEQGVSKLVSVKFTENKETPHKG